MVRRDFTPEQQAQAAAAAAARGNAPASEWFGGQIVTGGGAGSVSPTPSGDPNLVRVEQQRQFYEDVAKRQYPNNPVEATKYYNYLVSAQLPADIQRMGLDPNQYRAEETTLSRSQLLSAVPTGGLKQLAAKGDQEAVKELDRRERLAELNKPNIEVLVNEKGAVIVKEVVDEYGSTRQKQIGVLGKDIRPEDLQGKNVVPIVNVKRYDSDETIAIPLTSAVSMAVGAERKPTEYVGDYKVGELTTSVSGRKIDAEFKDVAGLVTQKMTATLPAGLLFETVKETTPLTVKYSLPEGVTEEQYKEAKRYQTSYGILDKQLEDPITRGAWTLQTLYSERDTDLIGKAILGVIEGKDLTKDVIREYAAKEYALGAGEDIIARGFRRLPATLTSTPSMVGFSLLGGLGLGAASTASGSAKIAAFGAKFPASVIKVGAPVIKYGKLVGKGALITVSGVGSGLAGADIYQTYLSGNTAGAIGKTVKFGAIVGAGAVGFKAATIKPPTYTGKELQALVKGEKQINIVAEGKKIYSVTSKETFKSVPLRESITVKDIKGLVKEGWIPKYKDIPLTKDTAFVGGSTKNVLRRPSGQFAKIGSETRFLDRVIAPKFTSDPTKMIDLGGVKLLRLTTIKGYDAGGELTAVGARAKSLDILMPLKGSGKFPTPTPPKLSGTFFKGGELGEIKPFSAPSVSSPSSSGLVTQTITPSLKAPSGVISGLDFEKLFFSFPRGGYAPIVDIETVYAPTKIFAGVGLGLGFAGASAITPRATFEPKISLGTISGFVPKFATPELNFRTTSFITPKYDTVFKIGTDIIPKLDTTPITATATKTGYDYDFPPFTDITPTPTPKTPTPIVPFIPFLPLGDIGRPRRRRRRSVSLFTVINPLRDIKLKDIKL